MLTTDQAIACDPTTPPEILLDLIRRTHSKTIRRLIAGNPNTPIHILTRLTSEFPQAVIENPVFALIELANPDSISEMNMYEILKSQYVPESIIHHASNLSSVGVIRLLLERTDLSEAAFSKIASRMDDSRFAISFFEHCFRFTHADRQLTTVIINLIEHTQSEVREVLVNHHKTPRALLEKLINDSECQISQMAQKRLAANQFVPTI
jgi:hypothetical protein